MKIFVIIQDTGAYSNNWRDPFAAFTDEKKAQEAFKALCDKAEANRILWNISGGGGIWNGAEYSMMDFEDGVVEIES